MKTVYTASIRVSHFYQTWPPEDSLQLVFSCTVCIKATFMHLGQWSASLATLFWVGWSLFDSYFTFFSLVHSSTLKEPGINNPIEVESVKSNHFIVMFNLITARKKCDLLEQQSLSLVCYNLIKIHLKMCVNNSRFTEGREIVAPDCSYSPKLFIFYLICENVYQGWDKKSIP